MCHEKKSLSYLKTKHGTILGEEGEETLLPQPGTVEWLLG